MPAQLNHSLIRGIICLQWIASAGQPVGSRELARRLGLDHTRVHRSLSTLAHLGLIEQTQDRKYRPGPALHVISAQSMKGSGLLPAALPHLMELRAEGFTVAVGVLWRGQVCYLYHQRPWQPMEAAIGMHELYPADKSSLGIALLASSSFEDWPESPESDLSEAVAHVHRQGYAVRRYVNGEVSIGVPIGQPPLAGLAVSSMHIGEEFIPQIVQRLRHAAEQIAAAVEKKQGKRLDAP
jgi:DNA-binding IclR family transcriptional regulator